MKKRQIVNFIMSTNISILDAFSWVTPIVIIILWAFLTDKVFNNQVPQFLHILVIISCAFILGTGGLFQVIKKEAPWIMGKTIKGNLAIVSGAFVMILFWGMGIIVLYLYLYEYFVGKF